MKAALLLSGSVLGLFCGSRAFAEDTTLTFQSQQAGNGTNLVGVSEDGTTATGQVFVGTSQVAYSWVGGTLTTIGTLGGSNSFATDLSSDGKVIVGYSNTAGGQTHAFRWMSGTMTDLGTLGGNFSLASAVSLNGLVVVGQSRIVGNTATHAFSWAGGTMTDLGTLGGTNSVAHNLSETGSVIVGESQTTGNLANHAVKWTSGVISDLGTLGGDFSAAYYVSADGAAIAGASNVVASGPTHAFRYVGTTMTDLGTLGGSFSSPNAISRDGTTVIGYSAIAGDAAYHAFRSVNGGVVKDLGTLGGTACANCNSLAYAVSADGKIVVGTSQTGPGSAYEAFRWGTVGDGMESIPATLRQFKVDITGYQLTEAISVSGDGSVIGGNGTLNGKPVAWIVRQTATAVGLTTLDQQSDSLQTAGKAAQTSQLAVQDANLGATQAATQGAASQLQSNQYQASASGKFNTEPVASGTLGIYHKLENGLLLGALGTAVHTQTPQPQAPSTYFDGGIGTLLVGQVPSVGFQWLVAGSAMTIRGTVNRGYANGAGQTFSSGSTSVKGYGATARIGYSFDVLPQVKVTPFGSYTFETISNGGYTETTGIFPAVIAGVTNRTQASRLGFDTRYSFTPNTWIWATVDWGHSLSGNSTASMSALLLGTIPITSPGLPMAMNWVDTTVGAKWGISKQLSVDASLTLVRPFDSFPYYIASAGVSWTF